MVSYADILIAFILGCLFVTFIFIIKTTKNKRIESNECVGFLEIVRSDNQIYSMFVDFIDPPDYFVQDQNINLKVHITETSF